MKILIVDDETSVTQYLKIELEDCCKDIEIITRNTGYEALSRLMQGDIKLLLTDIAMPDMDGYELFSRAKEYDENLPIIMMTGFGYDPGHAVVKSRQDGLQDVLFKPFDTQKLFDLIKKRVMGE
ncbi:response regulator [Candidatus Cloacimonadota bacterium]